MEDIVKDMPTQSENSEVQMNEMQLFEVGLSITYGGAYAYKYYIAATNDLEARSKAQRFVIQDIENYYEGFTEENLKGEKAEALAEAEKFVVTRNQSLGSVIV